MVRGRMSLEFLKKTGDASTTGLTISGPGADAARNSVRLEKITVAPTGNDRFEARKQHRKLLLRLYINVPTLALLFYPLFST